MASAMLSGLLMFSAFPPLDFSWAAWISLSPLTMALIKYPSGIRSSWREGILFGASFFFPTLFWVTEVSWFGWLLLSGLMVLYPALWLVLVNPVFRQAGSSLSSLKNLNRASLGAFLWIGLEWVRGWMLTGFPWNLLGVSQWKMAGVIQIAEWGGVLMISWLVAFISIILGLTVIRLIEELRSRQKMRPHFEFTLGMMVLGLVLLFGFHVIFHKDTIIKEVNVLAVQPDIPQDPWNYTMPLEEVIAKLEVFTVSGLNTHQGNVDLIVWPETPIGQEMHAAPEFRDTLRTIQKKHSVPLLMGSIVYAGTDLFNAAMLYPGEGGPPQLYYKNHLVLMGETVPLADQFPLIRKLIPLSQNFSPGTAATVLSAELRSGETIRIAPLICFEDIFGYLARRYAGTQTDFLVNITNDGWFNRSPQSQQHFANAVFRAIENRKPLLRVSNNGITGLIDHKGIVREGNFLGEFNEASAKDAGTLQATIYIPETRTTLFQLWGNWFGIVGFIGLLATCAFYGMKRLGVDFQFRP